MISQNKTLDGNSEADISGIDPSTKGHINNALKTLDTSLPKMKTTGKERMCAVAEGAIRCTREVRSRRITHNIGEVSGGRLKGVTKLAIAIESPVERTEANTKANRVRNATRISIEVT